MDNEEVERVGDSGIQTASMSCSRSSGYGSGANQLFPHVAQNTSVKTLKIAIVIIHIY